MRSPRAAQPAVCGGIGTRTRPAASPRGMSTGGVLAFPRGTRGSDDRHPKENKLPLAVYSEASVARGGEGRAGGKKGARGDWEGRWGRRGKKQKKKEGEEKRRQGGRGGGGGRDESESQVCPTAVLRAAAARCPGRKWDVLVIGWGAHLAPLVGPGLGAEANDGESRNKVGPLWATCCRAWLGSQNPGDASRCRDSTSIWAGLGPYFLFVDEIFKFVWFSDIKQVLLFEMKNFLLAHISRGT